MHGLSYRGGEGGQGRLSACLVAQGPSCLTRQCGHCVWARLLFQAALLMGPLLGAAQPEEKRTKLESSTKGVRGTLLATAFFVWSEAFENSRHRTVTKRSSRRKESSLVR